MPGVPIHRDLALRTLRKHGPMSKAELAELLGPLGKAAAGAISTARHQRPGEFFRIVRYDRQRGRSGREIPIYSHAGGQDAPRRAHPSGTRGCGGCCAVSLPHALHG